MSSSNKINSVFYADSYHPIQAGSIDGTDILPHDNAIYRALLCSSAGLYDPLGDPKVIGDPYRTVFVGRLSDQTDEESLRKAMSQYGRVKNLRLVRHIVTGASRGYAFVEYETDREMRRAYEDAHHSVIDDNEVIVDYSRQQLMPGWIPRRLGGGLGGKKESGQLRFGGRERPFRAPLRPIPYDDLKRLGIPPPPEGQYMTRFEVPSPPRRSSSLMSGEGSPSRHRRSQERRSVHTSREHSPSRERRSGDKRSSHTIRGDSPSRHRSEDRRSAHTSREYSPSTQKRSEDRRSKHRTRDDSSSRHSRYEDREEPSTWSSGNLSKEETSSGHRRFDDRGEDRQRHRRSPVDRNESSHKHDRHDHEHSYKHKKRSSTRESSPRQRKRSTRENE